MCYVWVPYVIAAISAAGSIYASNANNKTAVKAIKEQVTQQASEETDARARQARQERARIRVAAAESGVQGASFESSLAQSLFDEGTDFSKIQDAADQSVKTQSSYHPQTNALGYGLAVGGAINSTYADRGGTYGVKSTSSSTGVQIKQK